MTANTLCTRSRWAATHRWSVQTLLEAVALLEFMGFWVVAPCGVVDDIDVSVDRATSIFKPDIGVKPTATRRGCIRKFPDCVYNEIYAYNNKHSLRSNTKAYGDKTH